MQRLICAIVLMFSALVPAAVSAQSFENLDRLDGLVANAVGADIGQQGGAVTQIDRRLKLAACPRLPTVEGPVFGAAVVRCEAIGWRIRVPLIGGGAAAKGPVAASAPAAVRRGDPVQLVAGSAGFTVSKMMIADEDGAVGAMVRVREDRKSAPVVAQVVDMGIVRVPGFNNY